MTLRWRIALILAGIALGVAALAASASYLSTASQLRSTIDDTLKTRAAAVNLAGAGGHDPHGGDGFPGPGGAGPDDGCPTVGSLQPASAAQLVSATGTITACIDGGPVLPVTAAEQALPADREDLRTVTIGHGRYRLLTTPWHGGGTLQIARSLEEDDALLRRLRLQLALLVAAATAAAAAMGWMVATRLARPIVRLRDEAHRIATTLDLATPIEVGGTGEVASLASSFALMVAAVGRAQDQQRRLVSDASHEMRTPMTSLRSNVELLRQIDRLPEAERLEVVNDVLEDIDELSSLQGELVDLASDLASAEPRELVYLGDLARTVSARLQRRADRQVTVEEVERIEVDGRPRQLERAISNLVDNASKYSGSGAPIDVVVDGTAVTVRDRGCGIPEGDLDRIFDRFYRAVEARTQPGSGLGLAIVDEVVRSHGGRVFARNREGGGAEVGFELPAAPPAEGRSGTRLS